MVNLITRRAVNRPAHLARGGLVYTVSLADGRVRPVAAGAAVNSASLRCGAGGRAAVVSYSAPEAPTTTVFAIDAARASARPVARLDGQYVDPVLDGDRVYLRQAGRIVRVAAGSPRSCTRAREGSNSAASAAGCSSSPSGPRPGPRCATCGSPPAR
ncbi:hypothetical protein ACFQV2_33900 [Actinokineospora soli]|uniref:Uncharacterized protein n=1 Tax=Actinokineospora soli TaxID=1048753 RepID=A0ABW2TY37_9PSEU